MAAMTSLVLALVLGGTAAAQPANPGAVDWHPAMPGPPQPVADSKIQQIQLVQLKPGQDLVPPVQPGPPSQIGVPRTAKIFQEEDAGEFMIRTQPPGLDQFTRRLSEEQLFRLLIEENRQKPGTGPLYFPDEEPVSTAPFTARQYPSRVHFVEPHYVSHGNLYFEQKNWERYGWSLGMADPVIQLGTFYYDLLLLPYHFGADVCHCYDSSAGKCLPGDPTPLLLYGERFSVTGLVFEAGTILGGMFIFP